MTQEVNVSSSSLKRSVLRELMWGWWLALLIGVLSVAAGIIVILKPSHSLPTLAVILGIFILLDGIVWLVSAVTGETADRGLLAVLGALSVVAGVLLIRHPLGGIRAVALILGIWLIAAGWVRLIVAFAYPVGRVWRIVTALLLVIFGIVIVSNPHIGYTTLAVIAGIGFICYGVAMLAVGSAMHFLRRGGAPVEPGVTAGARPRPRSRESGMSP